MKTCTQCSQAKALDAFRADKRASDGRSSECKECSKKYKVSRETRAAWLKANRDWLQEQKNRPCTDCGIEYPGEPFLMDFDHLPGTEKVDDPSRMVRYGIEAMKIELAKCELVCCICHRRRTHARRI